MLDTAMRIAVHAHTTMDPERSYSCKEHQQLSGIGVTVRHVMDQFPKQSWILRISAP